MPIGLVLRLLAIPEHYAVAFAVVVMDVLVRDVPSIVDVYGRMERGQAGLCEATHLQPSAVVGYSLVIVARPEAEDTWLSSTLSLAQLRLAQSQSERKADGACWQVSRRKGGQTP